MNISGILKNKKCSCGKIIEEQEFSELGILLKDDKLVLRFKCSSCGINGKILLSAFSSEENRKSFESYIESLTNENNEKSDKKTKKSATNLEHFDINKLGCLFIPKWTNDYFSSLIRNLMKEEEKEKEN